MTQDTNTTLTEDGIKKILEKIIHFEDSGSMDFHFYTRTGDDSKCVVPNWQFRDTNDFHDFKMLILTALDQYPKLKEELERVKQFANYNTFLQDEITRLKAENEELKKIKINLQGNGEQIIQDIMDELNKRIRNIVKYDRDSDRVLHTLEINGLGSDMLNFVRDTLNKELFGVGKNTVMGGNHDYTNIKNLQQENNQLKQLKQEIVDLIRNENVTDGNYELWEKLQQLLKGDST